MADPVKEQEAENKKADKKYTIGGNVYTVDQETTNQLVLDEAAAAQTRINMKLAAEEDKGLKTYFTTEEMRAAQSASDQAHAQDSAVIATEAAEDEKKQAVKMCTRPCGIAPRQR